jgi:type IV pilus assembly protein PilB
MAEQRRTGDKLGDIIIKRGMVSSDDLEYILSRQFATPALNLQNYQPSPEALTLIPSWYMRKHQVVPVEFTEKGLTIAMSDPRNFKLLDELRFMTGKRIYPVVASVFNIKEALARFLGDTPVEEAEEESGETFREGMDLLVDGEEFQPRIEDILTQAAATPNSETARRILATMAVEKLSHLHFLKKPNKIEISARVGGVIEKTYRTTRHPMLSIISILKVRAGVYTGEGSPFEGAFNAKINQNQYRFTISGLPTHEGEHLVLSCVKEPDAETLALSDLGFYPNMLASYKKTIARKHGLILYVAPQLNGVTTTMYATLREVMKPDSVAISYERNAKTRLPGVLQVDPDTAPNVDQGEGFRILLSQDTDYLLIDDISSPMAMRSAVHAALGGSLVLARAKDKSALGFLVKMANSGVSQAILASALVGVVGQRLVETLCPNCAKHYEPVAQVRAELEKLTGIENPLLHRAPGCKNCGKTGRVGNIGIFEFFPAGKTLQKIIMEPPTVAGVEEVARKAGLKLLLQDGMMKALEGKVSYEQVHASL